jgi:dipeptidyl aminopeptidase/acylaminoacyl peptidase
VVPNYVTASGYVEEIPGRTKVGDVQGSGRLLYLRLGGDAPRPTGAAGGAPNAMRVLRAVPAATARDSALPLPQAQVLGWNDPGTHALIMSVTRDFKRRYLSTVSASAGTVRVVDELRDTAWVGGPCARCAGWYDGGRRIWFVSEADGFAHLYTVAADGSDRRQLTRGRWEVTNVELTVDERSFFLTTSEVSPFEQHVYRMSVAGGARERLTQRPGGHNAVVSPDGRRFADVFSQANRPPELFVQDARAGAPAAQLTVSPTAEWRAYPWLRPAIVRIPASDGAQVPARIYRPADVGAAPNGAAVIFVHGAGYLHNVHDWWSTYAREYMFHHYLARKGYVVLDLDYRASAGYGRDWRTAIYRHMGGRDLQDQVDAVRWLGATYQVPPRRVGIYGGSYGGFITLMALFTQPDSFGAGAALRAVTNWANYNHPYTGSILNLPQDDSLAYRRSSPIYFAEGLRAPLLLAHGMIDVNVHFQDIVELTQRLIELGKTDWTLAPYPVEDHGFVRPSSWTDEFRRIDELFDRALLAPYRPPSTSTSTR